MKPSRNGTVTTFVHIFPMEIWPQRGEGKKTQHYANYFKMEGENCLEGAAS